MSAEDVRSAVTRLEAIQAELVRAFKVAERERIMLAESALNSAIQMVRHAMAVMRQHSK